ncbi:hypothetical protein H0H81_012179 [Sphagnurus paluster]|uniref:Uncharacterized protein n=1 Tax=Sphagnurus paluster TaxID=117069 RepID=A0A9P7FU41_9AGAR|nr:hypothetical protein H0H81_012179 [Sphagnurus paluster]
MFQLVFSLTDSTSWSDVADSNHGFHEMYFSIVDFFEGPVNEEADAHATTLLRWWNFQIFGHPAGRRVGHVSQSTSQSGQILRAQWGAFQAEKATMGAAQSGNGSGMATGGTTGEPGSGVQGNVGPVATGTTTS